MAPKYRDAKTDPFVNMNENFKNHAEEILESLGLFLGLDDLEFGEEDDTCILQLDDLLWSAGTKLSQLVPKAIRMAQPRDEAEAPMPNF